MSGPARARLAFIVPCLISLIAGLWGGLLRLGWQLEPGHVSLPSAHGPLMISGFLGALICLERAVGLGDRRGYVVPAAGAGGIAVAVGLELQGRWLIAMASLGLVVLYLVLLRRRVESFTLIMVGGAIAWPSAGARLLGAGLIALALWLLRYDVARWTVRQSGLPRFVALCLLSGYFWLCAGGVLAVVHGGLVPGPHYDAILHSLFLGFVFAMVFGHAPIIIPAVMRVQVRFSPAFYVHLLLLHASLSVRVLGDLLAWGPGRTWGGSLNEAVVLAFIVNTVIAVRAGRKQQVGASTPLSRVAARL